MAVVTAPMRHPRERWYISAVSSELAKMQKEKLEASAAMVKLTLEHRDVVRELR